MKTLSQPAAYQELLDRLERLRVDSPRQWGRMTAHQMVVHLTDGFRSSTGEIPASRVDTWMSRNVVKFLALWLPMPWPKGVPTMPEVDQEKNGTRPAEFAADLATLRAYLARLVAPQRDYRWAPHPMFGDMSENDRMRWAYLHVDHHLRQFGL